jgi:hypothetical protein
MKRRFRVKVWTTIVFVGTSGLAFIIAALLQCVPISTSSLPPLAFSSALLLLPLLVELTIQAASLIAASPQPASPSTPSPFPMLESA